MKALLTAAVVMIAIQPAFAQQPRTPAEITADCVITYSVEYRAKLNREYPNQNPQDPLFVEIMKAVANAIASKCPAK